MMVTTSNLLCLVHFSIEKYTQKLFWNYIFPVVKHIGPDQVKIKGHCSNNHSGHSHQLAVRHRVQKTGKSRSLKKFGYTQDNALLFRPNCCPLLFHL